MSGTLQDFEALCRREYPRLVGALGLYTGNRAVAEELAQESLARAWRRWPKVSGSAIRNSTEAAIKNPQPRPREIPPRGHETSSREV